MSSVRTDSPSAYPVSPLTTPTRYRERATYDRAAVHEALDASYLCHLGFVVDGAPRVLPTLFVRVGDTLYLHGSTASTPLLTTRREGGLPIVVEVTHVDGLVLARSQFHHSANYRSVVAHGVARLVTDEATKRTVLAALVDKISAILADSPRLASLPDELRRSLHTRPPTAAELAQTAVAALDLCEVSLKQRSAAVGDDEADLELPYWAGVVPVRTEAGLAEPADGITVPAPGYVRSPSPWRAAERMVGRHVTMEPLTVAHAAELFAALDDAEVWRYMSAQRPTDAATVRDLIAARVDDARVQWLLRDATTGEAVGTTSYYGIDERRETLTVGATMIAPSRWGGPANAETKLLLLCRAFDTLGAGRVEFNVDPGNERSQAAMERLGATREGVLRRHKRRGDGTWRDSVLFAIVRDDWPSVRNHIANRIAAKDTEVHAGRH